MVYTPKIQKALIIAKKAHKDALRKDKKTPYIEHPLAVALLLSRIDATEDLICAGILHDTVEDSKGKNKITLDFIKKQFGKSVHRMVKDVTEEDKSLDWDTRKRLNREKIPTMQRDSQLLRAADMLHNIADVQKGIEVHGKKILKNYNAPPHKLLDNYTKKYDLLNKVWPQNPFLPEIKDTIDTLTPLLNS